VRARATVRDADAQNDKRRSSRARRTREDAMDLGVDDELGLPKATIAKMIAEALHASTGGSGSLRMAPECRDMVVECCQEFVHAVSAEANEVSTREGKSTITAEHVLAALRRLGFDAYEGECEMARDEAKEEETEKRELKKKRKTTQMSEEDAIAMQQELFARAAARMAGAGGGDGGGEANDGGAMGTLGSLG